MAPITGDCGSSAPVVPRTQYGVWGQCTTDAGVIGTSLSGEGVHGESLTGQAVVGLSTASATGVTGESVHGVGVHAYSLWGNAVEAYTFGGNVAVPSDRPGGSIAVLGSSHDPDFGIGVYGLGPNVGVAAVNSALGIVGPPNAAYLAGQSTAGWFVGDVVVKGALWKSGGGFLIDHPTDPGGKLLAHSFVESSDMKNLYDGIAVLDENGAAEIDLPAWFEALNGDFRYQLTALGRPAPNLHVSQEVTNGAFRIAGGPSGAKVCWQVTGVRRDTWATASPLVVEQLKSENERGHFLHPELRGQSSDQGIGSIRHPLRPPKRS